VARIQDDSLENKSVNSLTKTCICNHCDQHIKFDVEMVGADIQCPSCGLDTKLYIPHEESVEKQPTSVSVPPKFTDESNQNTPNLDINKIRNKKNLVECKECGEFISRNATSCPSCGNQIGRSSRALKAAGLIILLPCMGIGFLTGELPYPIIGLTVGGFLFLLGIAVPK